MLWASKTGLYEPLDMGTSRDSATAGSGWITGNRRGKRFAAAIGRAVAVTWKVSLPRRQARNDELVA